MNKKAIVVVSFGTEDDRVREDTIGALEKCVAEAFPERRVCRAFTGNVVLRRLAQRGIEVDPPETALEKLHREGFRNVTVMPTYLAPGGEMRRLQKRLEPLVPMFEVFSLTQPLLAEEENRRELALIMDAAVARKEKQAVLWMGHGTDGEGNAVYAQLAAALGDLGREDMYPALLKGEPGPERALARMEKNGIQSLVLVPLMLSAGSHVREHMTGTAQDSWINRCRGAGLEVRCEMTGLLRREAVRQLYVRHLKRATEEKEANR